MPILFPSSFVHFSCSLFLPSFLSWSLALWLLGLLFSCFPCSLFSCSLVHLASWSLGLLVFGVLFSCSLALLALLVSCFLVLLSFYGQSKSLVYVLGRLVHPIIPSVWFNIAMSFWLVFLIRLYLTTTCGSFATLPPMLLCLSMS